MPLWPCRVNVALAAPCQWWPKSVPPQVVVLPFWHWFYIPESKHLSRVISILYTAGQAFVAFLFYSHWLSGLGATREEISLLWSRSWPLFPALWRKAAHFDAIIWQWHAGNALFVKQALPYRFQHTPFDDLGIITTVAALHGVSSKHRTCGSRSFG